MPISKFWLKKIVQDYHSMLLKYGNDFSIGGDGAILFNNF